MLHLAAEPHYFSIVRGAADPPPLREQVKIDMIDNAHLVLLFLAIGVIAFLYSSVGHAGASGYIATMTLFGIVPAVIRPTALVLNILFASIGAFQFWRAGHFCWKLFWQFSLLSLPAPYFGAFFHPVASL